MAKLVYGLMQSLDGYVDHMKLGPPSPAVSRHFMELVRNQSGLVYGRVTYEIMRYWDEDSADWDAEDRDFAAVWRSQPKWVAFPFVQASESGVTLNRVVALTFARAAIRTSAISRLSRCAAQ